MIRAVPEVVRAPATRAILLRLALFLIVVRLAVRLPLRAGLPDLGPAFHADPFLALLDVFSGGALARGSVLALGPYPFLLGRLAARRLATEADRVRKLSYQLTLAVAVILAAAYPFFFDHLAGGRYLALAPDIVLTLVTGALLTAWLASRLDDETEDGSRGLRLLVAFHVLATLPGYLLWDSPSAIDQWTRASAAVAVAIVYLGLSSAERRFPLGGAGFPARTEKRSRATPGALPFALNSSRVAPLLGLLAAFGAIQLLATSLLTSEAGVVRKLAALERSLTGLRSPGSWLTFLSLGFLVKIAASLAAMAPLETATVLQQQGLFIPGVRPGAETGRYLFRALGRIVWIEPLLTLGLLLMTTNLAPAPGFWPVFLIPILYVTHPLADLRLLLRSRLLLGSYQGLLKRASPGGGNRP